MKTYKISGVIGWDSTAKGLSDFLNSAKGDDVQVIISSPGGLVGEALEMFNDIRNYSGNASAVASGYVMSAASYILTAFKKANAAAEDNAVVMIHNAQGLAWGDHNEMEKTGQILKGLSAVIGQAYAKFTGRTREEVAEMMDAETWLFGDQIALAGFAGAMAKTEEEEDMETATAKAKAVFSSMLTKLASDKGAFHNDLSRAVTALGTGIIPANDNTERSTMDLKELKAKFPDLVAAIIQEATAEYEEKIKAAREDGVKAENERQKAVRANLVPGHEALIEAMAGDMKTTGPEAAVAIIQAEQKLRKDVLNSLQSGAPPVVPPSQDDPPKMTVEEKARADWDKSEDLRNEFADRFETYLATIKGSKNFKERNPKDRGEK